MLTEILHPGEFLSIVNNQKVTVFSSGPSFYRFAVDRISRDDLKSGSLRLAACCGDFCEAALQQKWTDKMGVPSYLVLVVRSSWARTSSASRKKARMGV